MPIRIRSELIVFVCLLLTLVSVSSPGQTPGAVSADLRIQYEELTAPDFIRAVEKSGATAVIPMGILEKHGPHLPLGTDLLDIREVVLRAARQEYTIVFPPYYFGQIFEAKHYTSLSKEEIEHPNARRSRIGSRTDGCRQY